MAEKEYIELDTFIDLLYVIRTHMTSITRYVKHDIREHPSLTARQFIDRHVEYQRLANNAVNNILDYVNGDSMKSKYVAADVVEVRHGEWIFDFELDRLNFYKCSVCGREEVLLAKESTDEYFPYCHCGAKMDGATDNNVGGKQEE